MKVFRRKGPWTVQLYWPTAGRCANGYFIEANCRIVLSPKQKKFGFELLGLGIGVCK